MTKITEQMIDAGMKAYADALISRQPFKLGDTLKLAYTAMRELEDITTPGEIEEMRKYVHGEPSTYNGVKVPEGDLDGILNNVFDIPLTKPRSIYRIDHGELYETPLPLIDNWRPK